MLCAKMMKENVRMADIAQRLGIAPSTVSRALNGSARISEARRQEILTVADELGYRPNPMVSALMKNRHKRSDPLEAGTIALVTDYASAGGWKKKDVCQWEYDGLVARAGEMGFKIEEFPLSDYDDDPLRLEKVLRVRGIRGVLLGFSRNPQRKLDLPTDHFAVAGLSAYFRRSAVDRSNFHGLYNVRLALDTMRRYGYKKIGLVVPEFNNRISGYLWSGGMLDWQRRLPESNKCTPFIPESDTSFDNFAYWIRTEQPDALLVYKLPVEKWLAKIGQHAPEDIGIAYLFRTKDEMDYAAGINGNLEQVGATALDLVITNLNTNQLGLPATPKEVLVKGYWQSGHTLRQITGT
jgi:LacI family transcriptional regulator|tara:strand:- start:287 stop:1342 length:1056 start_codon:yes stop_codon:yes gene_type:complete